MQLYVTRINREDEVTYAYIFAATNQAEAERYASVLASDLEGDVLDITPASEFVGDAVYELCGV